MDLLVGSDLQEVLQKRGYLALDRAVDYVLQACEGVAEVHALGIIHRDLKPANLFLTWLPSGVPCVKVLDFGIAKHVGPGAPEGAELTRTGMVFGLPAYMSPEQMKHTKNADARSDAWPMGVVLYQLVTGTLPFFSEAIFELAVKVAVDKPVPPGELCPGMPAALEDVILRCLEKNADRRHQTMRDLMAALSAVRVVAETSTLLLLPPTEPAPPVVDRGPERAHPGEVSTAPADGVEAPQAPAESALKTLSILGPHCAGTGRSGRNSCFPRSRIGRSHSACRTRLCRPRTGTTTGLARRYRGGGLSGGVPVPAIGAIRYARAVDAVAEGASPDSGPTTLTLRRAPGPPPPDFELTPDTDGAGLPAMPPVDESAWKRRHAPVTAPPRAAAGRAIGDRAVARGGGDAGHPGRSHLGSLRRSASRRSPGWHRRSRLAGFVDLGIRPLGRRDSFRAPHADPIRRSQRLPRRGMGASGPPRRGESLDRPSGTHSPRPCSRRRVRSSRARSCRDRHRGCGVGDPPRPGDRIQCVARRRVRSGRIEHAGADRPDRSASPRHERRPHGPDHRPAGARHDQHGIACTERRRQQIGGADCQTEPRRSEELTGPWRLLAVKSGFDACFSSADCRWGKSASAGGADEPLRAFRSGCRATRGRSFSPCCSSLRATPTRRGPRFRPPRRAPKRSTRRPSWPSTSGTTRSLAPSSSE